MLIKKNSFLGIYVLLVFFDLACGFEALSSFRVISKPLLLISLLVYFISQAKHNRNSTFHIMVGALFSSLLGDIFLLFEKGSGVFFAIGLASFLLAHILYVFIFSQNWNKNVPKNFWLVAIFFFAYGGILFYTLKDGLGALKIPVVLYIMGILAMVITAYRRQGNVPKRSFNLVFTGALFFVASDSVLAVDKFLHDVPFSHIIIMGTYATAQYLITQGVLKQGDFGS